MKQELRASLAELLRDWVENADLEDEMEEYSGDLAEEMIDAAVIAYDAVLARAAKDPEPV